jgi:hypothetical protein
LRSVHLNAVEEVDAADPAIDDSSEDKFSMITKLVAILI